MYEQAGTRERCDDRGLPLSLTPDPHVGTQGAAVAQGASQQQPKLRARKPGKSGLFGVSKIDTNRKATPWRADMSVHGAKKHYVVGYFATKEEAARAYDAEVRRRGWTQNKRLNCPVPEGDGSQPASSAAAGEAPGPD